MFLTIAYSHFYDTFVQARFNQARLSCELNSCITLYFILLSMTQAHATYWGKLRKCGLEGMGQFL